MPCRNNGEGSKPSPRQIDVKCQSPFCNGDMIGPLTVKVLNAHVPNPSLVNYRFWKCDFEKKELAGLGYVCLRCGYSRFVKLPQVDEETRMLALD